MESDDERDSGTESDDENIEIENIINDDDGNHHDTSSYGSLSPINHPPSPGQLDSHLGLDEDSQIMDRTHEITENSVETISFASELEGRSWEFGRHSSEEELAQINREGVAEKRKWSQVLRNGCCDSAGSSDEEVKELMLRPQPVLFRASPPKGVQKLIHSPPAKYFFTNVSRVPVAAISPRKRHRQISVTEVDQDSGVQRPCLDFEKMQNFIFHQVRSCQVYYHRRNII
ncbi:hypothetical protein LOTGIDRAFT_159800 [Lottia gigantea]|uniref:Uncharacterized protein n=1 Tax=Lottia gigantea TaxID=225164 RepID=V4ART0_LOTGI|nr:hypothetical protein LOTGIDRAFT_159800 [Lottia gigantea]ESO96396.1 hypothetical protein LOTGIDRAFT_159800 [Lottia gigantea]